MATGLRLGVTGHDSRGDSVQSGMQGDESDQIEDIEVPSLGAFGMRRVIEG